MDREAWHAAIRGVAKSQTRLSDGTELKWCMVHRKYMRDTKLNNTVSTLTKYERSNGGKRSYPMMTDRKGLEDGSWGLWKQEELLKRPKSLPRRVKTWKGYWGIKFKSLPMNCFLAFFQFHFPLALLSDKIALMYTFKIITMVFLKMYKQANSSFLTFAGDIQRIL